MRWISADAFGSERIVFVFSHGENESFTARKVQFSRISNFITGVPKHCGEKGILFNERDLGHCWPQNIKIRIVSQLAELQVAIIFNSHLIHLLTQLFFFLDELD